MAELEFATGNVVVNRYMEALFNASLESAVGTAGVAEQIALIKDVVMAIPNNRKFLKKLSFFADDGLKFVRFLKENLDLCVEVRNFLDLLLVNDRFYLIIDICCAFADHLDKVAGKKRVYLTLAEKQSDSAFENLMNKVKDTFGKQTECITRLDPSLKGGFTLQYKSKVLDYSLASKLRRLRSAIRREGYEN